MKMINKMIGPVQIYYSGKLTARKFIPGIAWFFILLVLLCIPGSELPKASDWLEKIYFDKWVHIGLFGVLAILFMAPVLAAHPPLMKKWTYIIFIASGVILWGLITEFIQHYFIAGRSFDMFDWMADTCGVIIAVYLSRHFFLTTGSSFSGRFRAKT